MPIFENGKKYQELALGDPYFYAFIYGHLSIRDNCLNCKFKNNHYADVILADFWKYKSASNLQSDGSGLSLILVNSRKGENIVASIRSKMQLHSLDLQKASYDCVSVKEKTDSNEEKRNRFFEQLETEGLLKAAYSNGMCSHMKTIPLKIKAKMSMMLQKYGVKGE